jgi:hypothetical protein
MTDQAVIEDQDIEELDVAPEAPETEDETTEGENQAAPDDLEEELIVTIGEETPPQEEIDENSAPDWVRKVRANDREKTRKLRQTERELEETRQKLASYEQQKQTQLGPKPTLEACDYDADLFERRLDAWKERKAVADRQQAETREAEAKLQEHFNSKFETYNARKKEVAAKHFRDFDEVEETVLHALNDTKRGLLLAHAKDPALLFYAIGKKKQVLQEPCETFRPCRVYIRGRCAWRRRFEEPSPVNPVPPRKKVSKALPAQPVRTSVLISSMMKQPEPAT